MPPSRAAPLGNGPDELHADRVYLEVTRDADGPGKLASREPLAKRRAQPVTGVRQHTAEAHTGRYHTVDLGQGDLRLCAGGRRLRAERAVSPRRSEEHTSELQSHLNLVCR